MKRRAFCQVAGLATGSLLLPPFLARSAEALAGVSGEMTFGVQVATSPHFLADEVVFHTSGLLEPTFTVANLERGKTYFWRANVSKGLITSSWSETFEFSTAVTVGTESPDGAVPDAYELGQNYPNPFNPRTAIPFAMPEGGHVTVRVFDMQGREVATLVNEFRPAGRHEVVWEAGHLASGAYFCIMQAADFKTTRKLILLK